MHTCTKKHSHIHGHTLRIHTATQSSKHMHMHALSFLTLLVSLPSIASPIGGYSTLATQPTSVKYATWWSILMFSFQGNDEYTKACRQKMHNRQSLALPDPVHSQVRQREREREQLYFNINNSLLLSMQSLWRPCILFHYRGERVRQCKCIHLEHFAVLDWSLTN